MSNGGTIAIPVGKDVQEKMIKQEEAKRDQDMLDQNFGDEPTDSGAVEFLGASGVTDSEVQGQITNKDLIDQFTKDQGDLNNQANISQQQRMLDTIKAYNVVFEQINV